MNQRFTNRSPTAPVRTLDEVCACSQTTALGMIDEVDHPEVGPLEQIAIPVNVDGQRPRAKRITCIRPAQPGEPRVIWIISRLGGN